MGREDSTTCTVVTCQRLVMNGCRFFQLVCCILIFQGCASEQGGGLSLPGEGVSTTDEVQDRLGRHFNEWYGTPYRYGGLDKRGVDCSGFVYITYRQVFGADIPRTTDSLARTGNRVTVYDLQPGDLVLFRTGSYNHVGLYLADGIFMHASTSKGVMFSGLDEKYWRDHFWQARRIIN